MPIATGSDSKMMAVTFTCSMIRMGRFMINRKNARSLCWNF